MKKASRPKTQPFRPAKTERFVLGQDRFEYISAVEGIKMTPDLRAARDQLDLQGLSAAERRSAIIKRFASSR